jgi:hypothetical protein
MEAGQQQPPSLLRLAMLSATLFGIFAVTLQFANLRDIVANWSKYRCNPTVMPFAWVFGHDTAANFKECMTGQFQAQATTFVGPMYDILAGFAGLFSHIVTSINALRTIIASTVGTATSVFRTAASRIANVLVQLRLTFYHMQNLFGRLYSTFYAVIYMGISAIAAATTMADSTIGVFFDTFCFDPATPVLLEDGTAVAIDSVRIGDVLKGHAHVTGLLRFVPDYQRNDMYVFGHGGDSKTVVSGNHVMYDSGGRKWKQVKDMADAQKTAWDGPYLVCLNTSTHTIPTPDGRLFADFDEADEPAAAVMREHEDLLNGTSGTAGTGPDTAADYLLGLARRSRVRMADGSFQPIGTIVPGDMTAHGRVLGIVREQCKHLVKFQGTVMASATLVWDPAAEDGPRWVRACLAKGAQLVLGKRDTILYHLVVERGLVELSNGLFVRDYYEVHTPFAESEQHYMAFYEAQSVNN